MLIFIIVFTYIVVILSNADREEKSQKVLEDEGLSDVQIESILLKLRSNIK